MELTLREYQTETIEAVQSAWKRDQNRPAVVLPTGSGKTVIFAALVRLLWKLGLKTVVLVHRDELVNQAEEKLHNAMPEAKIGVVKAARNEVDAHVVIASVQTLARENRRNQLTGVGALIVDECFPAGTKVGAGVPIERIRPGEMVWSWDEDTGHEIFSPVLSVSKRRPERLIQLQFEDGATVVTTPNHPFMTTAGWTPAALLHGEVVVQFTHHANATNRELHPLRGAGDANHQNQDRRLENVGENVLLGRSSGRVDAPGSIATYGQDQPPARIRTNEAEQSHAPTRVQGEDASIPAGTCPSTRYKGWEWRSGAAPAAGPGNVLGVANRTDHPTEGRRTALPLQGGHRSPDDEGVRRGGWGIPFRAGPPSLRPKARRTVVGRRVVDVQVLEPGCDGTYGGLCPDGFVYNLEVAGTHTYLIEDGLVVHNCHHAMARTYRETLEHYGAFLEANPTPTAGFTATLVRGDGKGLGTVWPEVVYEKDIEWMCERGYLVWPKGKKIDIDGLDLAQVARTRGDYQDGDLGKALMSVGAGQHIAKAITEHAPGRPGVVFAPTVESAYGFAADLNDAGIVSEVITGKTPLEDRKATYQRVYEDKTQVLVNCMVLTEGFDMPKLSVLVPRPTGNAGLYTQMVGRGLRPWPGKEDCLVLDLFGNAGKHKLVTLKDLSKYGQRDDETMKEAKERVERERAEKGEASGVHTAEDIDLFGKSRSAWLQTYAGIWFVPTRSKILFLWPTNNGHFLIGRCDNKTTRGGEWFSHGQFRQVHPRSADQLTLDYAMSWAEQAAREIDPSVSQREASWRTKREAPSPAQVQVAQWKKIAYQGKSKAEVSDLISVAFASKLLDPGNRR